MVGQLHCHAWHLHHDATIFNHHQRGFGWSNKQNDISDVRTYACWKRDLRYYCLPAKGNPSAPNVSRCSVLVWNVPSVPHRETAWGRVFYLSANPVVAASEPLSLIYRCGFSSLLPGFDWMLAPLGEHVGLWSLAAGGFTATVKERIPVLMDAQSRRVIMKGGVRWVAGTGGLHGGGGWSK